MKKLNFGCGSRFSPDWVNIDVYAWNNEVQRVNLLKTFPFPEGYFDAVYSSHVLEHFTPRQADHLISESFRVLRPGGILRTVVPDLEATCREYIRVLDSSTMSEQPYEYDWIILELLTNSHEARRREKWAHISKILKYLKIEILRNMSAADQEACLRQ